MQPTSHKNYKAKLHEIFVGLNDSFIELNESRISKIRSYDIVKNNLNVLKKSKYALKFYQNRSISFQESENIKTWEESIGIENHLSEVSRKDVVTGVYAIFLLVMCFQVYIHHPADLPQSSLYYYAVLHDQVSSMALSLSYINTSDSLKKYDAETYVFN